MIEEGFEIDKLHIIASSMSDVCKKVGAKIVTGDTKVVEKGLVDGIFINTSGIGRVSNSFNPRPITSDDEIILTGTIAEHGTTILKERYDLKLQGDFKSDCQPLSDIISALGVDIAHVKLMRDPTRAGLATALCEISESNHICAVIEEENLPIRPNINAVHDLLGTDPLYFASEGRMILVVEKGHGEIIRKDLKTLESCKDSAIIGKFDNSYKKVCLKTSIGGERILTLLENQMISRIC